MQKTNTVNFATNTRWLAHIPFSTLFPGEGDIKVNLTQFDIPQITIGVTEMPYKGYSVEMPTGVIQPSTKECVFSYLMDSNMETYWRLYRWCSMFTKDILATVKVGDFDAATAPLKTINISVYILDEWKKPAFKVTYYDCFIKSFGQLSMSYQDAPKPLDHTFTVAYLRFDVEKLNTVS